MGWLLNLGYVIVLLLALPWVLWRRGKRIGGFRSKLTGSTPIFASDRPRIWLHAVSVGEVLLLKTIIASLRNRYPHYECVLSVTTATGREVAEKAYPDITVFWFPFDFTWAVRRALRRVQPRLIVLAELELWPNFVRLAKKEGAAVVVVNGRMGERSYRGYRRVRWLMKPILNCVDRFAVQQAEYAERLVTLGMPGERIVVTGSVKFEGVMGDREHSRVEELRELFGSMRNAECGMRSLVWVVGSTQEPEEAWAIEIYRVAKREHPDLRLILVPRHKERFDEVAAMLRASGLPFVRRSEIVGKEDRRQETEDRSQKSEACTSPPIGLPPEEKGEEDIILVDTLGELSYVWGLADLAFVGGSFNERGGQNMIEPAAYGVPVMFGPNVWNFQQIADALLKEEAAIQVRTKEEWRETTLRLLDDVRLREELGERARRFVLSQQGATARTMTVLEAYLDSGIRDDLVRAA